MALAPRVFLTAEQIQKRVREMGDQISADYPEGPLYLISVLKDAVAHRVHGDFELRPRQNIVGRSESYKGPGRFHRRAPGADRGRYRRQRRHADRFDEPAVATAPEVARDRYFIG